MTYSTLSTPVTMEEVTRVTFQAKHFGAPGLNGIINFEIVIGIKKNTQAGRSCLYLSELLKGSLPPISQIVNV